MNVQRLLQVKADILEEPRRINMDYWIKVDPDNEHACKTTACISGWACIHEVKDREKLKTLRGAAARVDRGVLCGQYPGSIALDLTSSQSDSLFYDTNWPEDFSLVDLDAGTPEYAVAVARAIDAFIACDGDWRKHRPAKKKRGANANR